MKSMKYTRGGRSTRTLLATAIFAALASTSVSAQYITYGTSDLETDVGTGAKASQDPLLPGVVITTETLNSSGVELSTGLKFTSVDPTASTQGVALGDATNASVLIVNSGVTGGESGTISIDASSMTDAHGGSLQTFTGLTILTGGSLNLSAATSNGLSITIPAGTATGLSGLNLVGLDVQGTEYQGGTQDALTITSTNADSTGFILGSGTYTAAKTLTNKAEVTIADGFDAETVTALKGIGATIATGALQDNEESTAVTLQGSVTLTGYESIGAEGTFSTEALATGVGLTGEGTLKLVGPAATVEGTVTTVGDYNGNAVAYGINAENGGNITLGSSDKSSVVKVNGLVDQATAVKAGTASAYGINANGATIIIDAGAGTGSQIIGQVGKTGTDSVAGEAVGIQAKGGSLTIIGGSNLVNISGTVGSAASDVTGTSEGKPLTQLAAGLVLDGATSLTVNGGTGGVTFTGTNINKITEGSALVQAYGAKISNVGAVTLTGNVTFKAENNENASEDGAPVEGYTIQALNSSSSGIAINGFTTAEEVVTPVSTTVTLTGAGEISGGSLTIKAADGKDSAAGEETKLTASNSLSITGAPVTITAGNGFADSSTGQAGGKATVSVTGAASIDLSGAEGAEPLTFAITAGNGGSEADAASAGAGGDAALTFSSTTTLNGGNYQIQAGNGGAIESGNGGQVTVAFGATGETGATTITGANFSLIAGNGGAAGTGGDATLTIAGATTIDGGDYVFTSGNAGTQAGTTAGKVTVKMGTAAETDAVNISNAQFTLTAGNGSNGAEVDGGSLTVSLDGAATLKNTQINLTAGNGGTAEGEGTAGAGADATLTFGQTANIRGGELKIIAGQSGTTADSAGDATVTFNGEANLSSMSKVLLQASEASETSAGGNSTLTFSAAAILEGVTVNVLGANANGENAGGEASIDAQDLTLAQNSVITLQGGQNGTIAEGVEAEPGVGGAAKLTVTGALTLGTEGGTFDPPAQGEVASAASLNDASQIIVQNGGELALTEGGNVYKNSSIMVGEGATLSSTAELMMAEGSTLTLTKGATEVSGTYEVNGTLAIAGTTSSKDPYNSGFGTMAINGAVIPADGSLSIQLNDAAEGGNADQVTFGENSSMNAAWVGVGTNTLGEAEQAQGAELNITGGELTIEQLVVGGAPAEEGQTNGTGTVNLSGGVLTLGDTIGVDESGNPVSSLTINDGSEFNLSGTGTLVTEALNLFDQAPNVVITETNPLDTHYLGTGDFNYQSGFIELTDENIELSWLQAAKDLFEDNSTTQFIIENPIVNEGQAVEFWATPDPAHPVELPEGAITLEDIGSTMLLGNTLNASQRPENEPYTYQNLVIGTLVGNELPWTQAQDVYTWTVNPSLGDTVGFANVKLGTGNQMLITGDTTLILAGNGGALVESDSPVNIYVGQIDKNGDPTVGGTGNLVLGSQAYAQGGTLNGQVSVYNGALGVVKGEYTITGGLKLGHVVGATQVTNASSGALFITQGGVLNVDSITGDFVNDQNNQEADDQSDAGVLINNGTLNVVNDMTLALVVNAQDAGPEFEINSGNLTVGGNLTLSAINQNFSIPTTAATTVDFAVSGTSSVGITGNVVLTNTNLSLIKGETAANGGVMQVDGNLTQSTATGISINGSALAVSGDLTQNAVTEGITVENGGSLSVTGALNQNEATAGGLQLNASKAQIGSLVQAGPASLVSLANSQMVVQGALSQAGDTSAAAINLTTSIPAQKSTLSVAGDLSQAGTTTLLGLTGSQMIVEGNLSQNPTTVGAVVAEQYFGIDIQQESQLAVNGNVVQNGPANNNMVIQVTEKSTFTVNGDLTSNAAVGLVVDDSTLTVAGTLAITGTTDPEGTETAGDPATAFDVLEGGVLQAGNISVTNVQSLSGLDNGSYMNGTIQSNGNMDMVNSNIELYNGTFKVAGILTMDESSDLNLGLTSTDLEQLVAQDPELPTTMAVQVSIGSIQNLEGNISISGTGPATATPSKAAIGSLTFNTRAEELSTVLVNGNASLILGSSNIEDLDNAIAAVASAVPEGTSFSNYLVIGQEVVMGGMNGFAIGSNIENATAGVQIGANTAVVINASTVSGKVVNLFSYEGAAGAQAPTATIADSAFFLVDKPLGNLTINVANGFVANSTVTNDQLAITNPLYTAQWTNVQPAPEAREEGAPVNSTTISVMINEDAVRNNLNSLGSSAIIEAAQMGYGANEGASTLLDIISSVDGTPDSYANAAYQINKIALVGAAAHAHEIGISAASMIVDSVWEHGSKLATASHEQPKGDLWITLDWNHSRANDYKAGGLDNGYKMDLYGATFGGDYDFANGLAAGLAVSVGGGEAKSKGFESGQKTDVTYWGINLYGTYTSPFVNLIGNVGYIGVKNKTKVGGDKGRPDANIWTVGLKAEKDFAINEQFTVTPHVGVRYLSIDVDDFNLRGFHYGTDKANLVQFPIGVAFAANLKTANGAAIKPFLDLSIVPTAGDKKVDNTFGITGGSARDVIDTTIGSSMLYQAKVGVNASYGAHNFGLNFAIGGGSKGRLDTGLQAKYRYVF